jgi:hypothetical protein
MSIRQVLIEFLIVVVIVAQSYQHLNRQISRNLVSLCSSTTLYNDIVSNVNPVVTLIVNDKHSPSYFQMKPTKDIVTWYDALKHVEEKMSWEYINARDPDSPMKNIKLNIIDINEVLTNDSNLSPILVLIGLNNAHKDVITNLIHNAVAVATFQCDDSIQSYEKFGSYMPNFHYKGLLGTIRKRWDSFRKNLRHQHAIAYDISHELWNRKSSGDMLFMLLILIDKFSSIRVSSVDSVTNTENTGLQEIQCMIENCQNELINCFKDPNCRAALACLNSCNGNDQVCQYRCITSYESDTFEKFAYCILQRNNCMRNSAKPPIYPNPQPMVLFRGQELTHEMAENIFIGYLQPRQNELNPLFQGKSSYSIF